MEKMSDRPTTILTRLIEVTPDQIKELMERIGESERVVNYKEVILFPVNKGVMLYIDPENIGMKQ